MASAASFPVDRLNNKPSLAVLKTSLKRCKNNPESEQLCRQLYERIKALHDAVAPLDFASPLKRKYIDILVRFVKLTHREALLLRLATSNSTPYKARELHRVLDDIANGLGVPANDPLMQWQEAWKQASEELRSQLKAMVSASNERMLANEIRGEKLVKEVLMTLYAGLESDESLEFRQFKRERYDRVRSFLDQHGPSIFNWYAPRQNVFIDSDQWIGNGTFGDVSRGTLLLQNGERKDVVVKQLFKHVTSDVNSTELFMRQLQFWNDLMTNEAIPKTHILQLYAAVHIGDPQLYVCEAAVNGNLMDFLGEEENKSLFWPMFLQAAEGLRILHSNGMVHGGLKCTNILVGEDGEGNKVAKLSDFGFSFIRGLSIELSNHKNKAMTSAVRWKPKEMLQETTDANYRFAADVYGLGHRWSCTPSSRWGLGRSMEPHIRPVLRRVQAATDT
ncbi:Serine/threonine protein kinase [Phytophthora cinnamomi]|uniref:Serine/threonine protein kinase n=1 Tax=Phytophthora cinnamomi TaxID=4785 RepID=UPI003559E89B|nr:Serine/threonine protein kinase [Phytophthora cinnamomi]